MELLSVIRRWRYRDHYSIREIARRTGLSRNTVRKYLRSDSVEPRFSVPDRSSKLDPYADKLSHMLRQEAGKSRKQKRTIKQLHADLTALGYDGSYNRVAAFARDGKAARQREQHTSGRGGFVPLAFLPGEAFQFDWSEDWAIIGGDGRQRGQINGLPAQGRSLPELSRSCRLRLRQQRGQRGARASTPSLRVPGRRPQCRPGRRPRVRFMMLTSPSH